MRFFASLRITLGAKAVALLEIVIILAILAIIAGSLVPLLIKSMETDREKITLERMKAIHEGIMGNPKLGYFGYVGDMGDFPTSLNDLLVKPAGVPIFTFRTNNVGMGWRGPYLDVEFQSLKDGWGNDFEFSTAAGLPEGQIKSAGPDGSLGNSDDIVFPFLPPGEKVKKNATLLVTVMVDDTSVAANLQGGGAPNPNKSKIKVFFAVNGEEEAVVTEAEGTAFDNIGFIFTTAISGTTVWNVAHNGLHAVEHTFQNATGTITTNIFNVALIGGVQSNVVFRHPQSGNFAP